MFCVVYEFQIKKGLNEEFESAWADFTEAIHRVCGSLGSRLHKTDNSETYVAYAQWPSRELFNRDIPKESYLPEEWVRRKVMVNATTSIKKIYELKLCDDHLRNG